MSVLIGVGVIATLGLGYIGHKGWLAFHRAVGIRPGTLKYIEPSQLPPPQMMQLTLLPDQIRGLPPVIIEQLLRIDGKADIFQQLRNEAIKAGHTPTISEDEFVVRKLLQVRLPELINSYQKIARHEDLLQQTEIKAGSRTKNFVTNADQMSKNKAQALSLVFEVLLKIETKLDNLLEGCQSEALQELQVMQRYLHHRP